MEFSREQFEQLVARALDDLPSQVKSYLKNIAVVVDDVPTAEQNSGHEDGILLGLYEGIPENEWGKGLGGMLPDKITLFQRNIEAIAQTAEQIEKEVRDTVWHEIAHYYGFDDEEIAGLSKNREKG